MEGKTNLSSIRKKTLSKRGIAELSKRTRKPLSHDEVAAPFVKTPTMKYMELKYHKPIEDLIASGTIYEAGKRLKLHPTTIYKWRLIIEEGKTKQFFEQFE